MRINTNHYIIRDLCLEDAEYVLELTHDTMVKKYVPYVYCEDIEDAKEMLNDVSPRSFYLAICKNEEIVGMIIAIELYKDGGVLDCNYLVSKKHRNQGIITEAMKSFISWLNWNTKYRVLNLSIENDNVSSIKIAEKLNATFQYNNKTSRLYRIIL